MSDQLPTKKSEIINQLSNNYPNFIKKDLTNFVDIILSEIKGSLKRYERVELRDIFSLEPRIQKERFARNPKTNEKIYVKKKFTILFKSSKMWLETINNEE